MFYVGLKDKYAKSDACGSNRMCVIQVLYIKPADARISCCIFNILIIILVLFYNVLFSNFVCVLNKNYEILEISYKIIIIYEKFVLTEQYIPHR